MGWPILTLLLLICAGALHFWWRARLRASRETQRELTELKDFAVQQTAQLQSQQRALLDSMVEGLLLLDAEGRVRHVNRACRALFALGPSVEGKPLLEVLRFHELAGLVGSLQTGKPLLGLELRVAYPTERWIEINASALFDASGGRQGTVLVFHDLTRLKKLERTREEFVANVSHELRTPLSLIKGYAETLLGGAKDDPEMAVRFLEIIDRNAERLTNLIQDLLAISELQSGRLQLNSQVMGLRGVVDKTLADYGERAAGKQATLVNQVPELDVWADPGRLEQALGNLVDNAIKYGKTGGTVTVGAEPPREAHLQVEIWVADDGPGIPAESLDRVFERFYRVDKARSRDQGGTGLGLSIVKHIVQSHGGRVWATSEPGQGAVFRFTLPARQQTHEGFAANGPAPDQPKGS